MRNLLAQAAVALLLAAPALAQDLPSGADPLQGQETFMRYCATCHGAEALGNGPMSAVLTLQPTNLTRLSATNDGVFPTIRVVNRIDGRDPLVSHGSPMPLFGPFFEGQDASMKAPDGMPILTSQPVVDLVAWLETLQQ